MWMWEAQIGKSPDQIGRRAADAIVAEIERRIAAGEIRDAAPLPPERILMHEFGASRTVVREAITTLASRGAIEARPRFRPVVRKAGFDAVLDTTGPVVRRMLTTPEGLKNLYDTRVFTERGLVRDAALRAGRDDIKRLKAALIDNGAARDDSERFYRTDTAFHRVLFQIPGNPVFSALHDGFVSWLAPHWEAMERSAERNERNFRAHEAIYQAILERDPDAAEGALAAHLREAWAFVEPTFAGRR